MPRKPNYGLNKHRKEQDRKAKKDAKLRERQQRREERSSQDGDAIPTEADHPDTSSPPASEGRQ